MIKFIVAEKNKKIEEEIKKTIHDTMKYFSHPFDICCLYHPNEIKPYLEENSKKIYILDIQLDNTSGITIAKMIRNNDLSSFIIILSHIKKYMLQCLEERLLIYDYISLSSPYKERLSSSLQKILETETNKHSLNIKKDGKFYHILLEDILYITKEKASRKIKIVTKDNIFTCIMHLYELEKKLNDNFIRVHRGYIVNIKKITKVDLKKNIIYFDTRNEQVLVSRNRLKNMIEKLNNN